MVRPSFFQASAAKEANAVDKILNQNLAIQSARAFADSNWYAGVLSCIMPGIVTKFSASSPFSSFRFQRIPAIPMFDISLRMLHLPYRIQIELSCLGEGQPGYLHLELSQIEKESGIRQSRSWILFGGFVYTAKIWQNATYTIKGNQNYYTKGSARAREAIEVI